MEPILPRGAFLAVWATIGIIGALWLFGAVRLPTVHDGQIGWLRRGFGVAFFAFSLLFLAGVDGRPLGRIESFLPPIAMSATSGGATANTDYEASLRQARLEGKPLLVNFTGVTCTNCRLMERYIFPAPEVKQVLDGMVVSELYTDRQTAGDRSNRALQQKLGGTEALPLYVLVDADGKVVRKFEGSTNDPAEFIRFLKGA
ncbi:MAG: hypothetical protein C4320_00220 [Armatimonadota bacterium]